MNYDLIYYFNLTRAGAETTYNSSSSSQMFLLLAAPAPAPQHCLDGNRDVTFGLVYQSLNAASQSIDELIQLVSDANGPSILTRDFNMPGID
jgi:hypothetical protein